MSILTSQLYRALDRLHMAVKECARIGFQESSPTQNEHHASIWNGLNDAQNNAEQKLKYFSIDYYERNFVPIEKERMDDLARKIADMVQEENPNLRNRHTWEAAYKGARELVSLCHHPR